MNTNQVNLRAADRWIYVPAAIGIAVVSGLGFAPSYYLRPFLGQTDSLTVLVHVHGALLTAWMLLFLVQATLVAIGRTDLHRRLGLVGIALVPIIFMVGVPMSIKAAQLGGNHMPGPPLPALALVLASFLEFAVLAGLGLWYRFRSGIHKRLMLLASATAVEAAAIRLPLELLDHSFVRVHLATDAVLLGIIAFDSARHRRLHRAFFWGVLFLVSMQALSLWISGTSTWSRMADAIVRTS